MFKKLIAKVARNLSEEQIPYIIIGGQAVLIYGEPRQTRDIDITLGVDIDQKEKVLNLIRKAGLEALPENCEEFIDRTYVLPCLELKSHLRIDFIFSHSEYEKVALNRTNKISINDTPVCFASPEDLIIHKIIAGRSRDLEDVRTVLVKQKELDVEYIEKWLNEFDKSVAADYTNVFLKIMRGF